MVIRDNETVGETETPQALTDYRKHSELHPV